MSIEIKHIPKLAEYLVREEQKENGFQSLVFDLIGPYFMCGSMCAYFKQ